MAKKRKKEVEEWDGKKKKRSIDITCQYCLVFSNIPSEYRDLKVGTRYCKRGGKHINGNAEACDNFDLATTFHCKKLSFDSDPAICINKLEKGISECFNCRQGEELYRYLVAPTIQFNIIGD